MDSINAESLAPGDGQRWQMTPLPESRFDLLISKVEDYAIVLLDLQGIVISWNKGAQMMEGYTSEEIIGRRCKIVYPREDIEQGLPEMLLTEALQKGKSDHEGWCVRKNGSRFWAHVTITALYSAGEPAGFLKITRDLTGQKTEKDKYANYIESLQLTNETLKRREELYHKMVAEVTDYAIILLDVEGNVLDWNKGAQKLKGYTPEEILGKNFRLFYTSEDKEAKLPDKLLQAATKNGHVTHEGYRIRKDGNRFWGSVAITALHDESGTLIGFSKVTKDLTEQKIADDQVATFTLELKQRNEELRRSEERYHKMIGEIQDYAILLLNREGEIQNWNAGAALIKGYSAKEAIGKNFRIFYTPEDNARGLPQNLLDQATINGRSTNEGWRKKKDGSLFWASVVITALHDNDRNVMGFSKVTRDLTERKTAEDALRATASQLELKNQYLERLNAELSSFAYIVSHDLKEPIRKIQTFAGRQLEPGKSHEQMLEYAHKIGSSASRMQRLMEALLSYSMMSNDPGRPEEVDLNEIFEAAKNDLELKIVESGAKVTTTKLPSTLGISFQLYQLFLNLLSNALKFNKRGEPPDVSVSSHIIDSRELPNEVTDKKKSYHQISFVDHGIGFDQVQSERIFEVFQRLDPKSDSKGTGIGLAIVRRVIQNHNGFITAQSKPGDGAKFQVYLPID